jgi:hypothetical protein
MIALKTKICSGVEKAPILLENVHSPSQAALHVGRFPEQENRVKAPLPDIAALLQQLALGTTSPKSDHVVAAMLDFILRMHPEHLFSYAASRKSTGRTRELYMIDLEVP